MERVGARFVPLACWLGLIAGASAESPVFLPCDDVPESVAALGPRTALGAYAIAPAASVAVAAMASPQDPTRSVLRFASGAAAPRDVKLSGRVAGLALTPDGKLAYAIVRVNDRKGAVRSVDLVRVDLDSGRTSVGASLPTTAGGLAVGSSGSTLLVASHDEIRTFQLPALVSGPLYRALGDNVGIAPVEGSSFVLLAQTKRIVLADLAGPQNRDGLALSQEVAAPAPLTGLLASTGERGPIALAGDGLAWCVRSEFPPAPPPPVRVAAEEITAVHPQSVAAAPAEPPRAAETAAPAPVAEPPAPAPSAPPEPAAPGSVSGSISGPSVVDVAALVFLGPDNVLHEAARVVPEENGRFRAQALAPGTYRIVAAGKGGRVLICEPPFITIRVSADAASEAPELKVLRAQ